VRTPRLHFPMIGDFASSALFRGENSPLPIILPLNDLNHFVISCGNYPSLRSGPISLSQPSADQILATELASWAGRPKAGQQRNAVQWQNHCGQHRAFSEIGSANAGQRSGNHFPNIGRNSSKHWKQFAFIRVIRDPFYLLSTAGRACRRV
jgi:hypothetical protein